MIKKLSFPFALFLFSLFVSGVFAETIRLKSGQIVQGKILEKTDSYIKVEVAGMPLTYFVEDISVIETAQPEALQQIPLDNPGLTQARNYFQEAMNYMGRAEYDTAIGYFKKCVSLDPAYAKAYAFMGLAYSYLKNDTLANQNLVKAKELCLKGADCAGLKMANVYNNTREKERTAKKTAWNDKISRYINLDRVGGIYLIVFPLTILLSLFFSFSLQSILILVAGLIASIIARLVFNDASAANVISYIFALFTTYFVMKSEIFRS